MVEAFDIADVNPNPARFDLKKAEAINASQMRLLSTDEITRRVLPFLKAAGVVGDPVHDADAPAARAGDAAGGRADQQAHRGRADAGLPVRRRGRLHPRRGRRGQAPRRGAAAPSSGRRTTRSRGCSEWSTAAIEEALQAALVEEMGLKPRNAFGPVRVAVTGRRVSPPLFESLELLGRERGLGRLRTAAPA